MKSLFLLLHVGVATDLGSEIGNFSPFVCADFGAYKRCLNNKRGNNKILKNENAEQTYPERESA